MKINEIYLGDCLEVMKQLEDNSISAIVTDPPYGLSFMGKHWDYDVPSIEIWQECLRVLKPGGYLLSFAGTRTQHRMAVRIEDAGFEIRDMIEYIYGSGFPKSTNIYKQLKKQCTCGSMEAYENGAKQDTKHDLRPMQDTDIPQTSPTKGEAELVLQSSVSEQGVHGTVQGQKPSQSIEDGEEPSVEGWSDLQEVKGQLQGSDIPEVSREVSTDGEKGRLHNATQASDGSTPGQTADENGSGTSHRPRSEQQSDREPCAFCKQWGTQAARSYGTGSALKPAHEPICLARKPLEGTLASNYLKHGTGGLNIDGTRVDYGNETDSRIGTDALANGFSNGSVNFGINPKGKNIQMYKADGRFPANLIHDGSDEVVSLFPNTHGHGSKQHSGSKSSLFGNGKEIQTIQNGGEGGSASRFFYCAKASKSERNRGCEGLEEKAYAISNQAKAEFKRGNEFEGHEQGDWNAIKTNKNNHPTVKPIALMEYLVRLVSQEGAVVLDPFAGSGSTLIACKNLGRNFIGIEKEADYIEIAKARLSVHETQ